MCVRYTLHKTDAALGAISRALGVLLESPEDARPRYNVAITDTVPVIAQAETGPALRLMRWGLVPSNERANPRPRLLANARAETAVSLSAFCKGIAGRRCLVPANGFYEWKDSGGLKLPHLFTLRAEEPFAFAGIWDPADGKFSETFCILTTTPNELVGRVHDRMPVLLDGETMPRWIGNRPLATEEFTRLTRPLAADRMDCRPVSRFVSNSRNQGPECLAAPSDPLPEPELDFG